MSIQWREIKSIQKDNFGLPDEIYDIGVDETMSLDKAMKFHPRKFIESIEKWCDFNNAETIGHKNKLNKHFNNPKSRFLIDFIKENNLKCFDIKTLLKLMNAENYSDGSLQRKILSMLVCKGIVRKHIIEYKTKKGDIKPKLVYSYNEDITPCPYLINGKCTFDWKKARKTKYFSKY